MIIGPDTTTCDACGACYEFTSHKDRCPYCCPKSELDDDVLEDYELVDEVYDDDSGFPSCHADQSQQAAYLERLKLLTDAEQESLPADAFEPVAYVE